MFCYYVVKRQLPNLMRDRHSLQVVSYSHASKSFNSLKTNMTCIFVRINSLLLLLLLLCVLLLCVLENGGV